MKFEELSWEEKSKIINKSKEDLLKEIDLEPLYEEIRKTINETTTTDGSSIKFTSKIIDGRCGKYIEIQSEELIDKVGIMAAALKSVKLETFNSSLEFNEKTLKAYWWGSISFRYEIADGGSNGMKVLYFDFKNGKYTFDRIKEGC